MWLFYSKRREQGSLRNNIPHLHCWKVFFYGEKKCNVSLLLMNRFPSHCNSVLLWQSPSEEDIIVCGPKIDSPKLSVFLINIAYMFQFSITFVTNYHKCTGLEQKFIVSQFCRPEVQYRSQMTILIVDKDAERNELSVIARRI